MCSTSVAHRFATVPGAGGWRGQKPLSRCSASVAPDVRIGNGSNFATSWEAYAPLVTPYTRHVRNILQTFRPPLA